MRKRIELERAMRDTDSDYDETAGEIIEIDHQEVTEGNICSLDNLAI